MADYNNFENDDFKVTVRPFGKRHWISWFPVLGKLLFNAPFFSGGHKAFEIKIKPRNKKYEGQSLFLNGSWHGPTRGDEDVIIRDVLNRSIGIIHDRKKLAIRIETPWLGGTGHHRFDGEILMDPDRHLRPPRKVITGWQTWVNFDLKSSDTLLLLIFGIAASAIITVTGGWIVGTSVLL